MGKFITDLSSVTTVGLDLAKHIFQVHGVDASGRVIVTKALRRSGNRWVITHDAVGGKEDPCGGQYPILQNDWPANPNDRQSLPEFTVSIDWPPGLRTWLGRLRSRESSG
jgi:hypothetical protein